MNYSDYDSDGYSSNEDADYVPSDDNLSEDDVNECEKEEPLHEDDVVPHAADVSKESRKRGGPSVRERKSSAPKEEAAAGAAEEPRDEADEENEAKQKKKSDELWASFLSEVRSRPKECGPQSGTAHKDEPAALKPAALKPAALKPAALKPAALKPAALRPAALRPAPDDSMTGTKPSGPATVTITKVFDFAGEEVRVNKEVSADSREAKSYLKSQSITADEESDRDVLPASCPPLPGSSAKRPAGVSNVLNRIGGKKQKMSTLEKSKMDWDAFKCEEGITEELAIHNRGREGYVERKNFLERVDHRQFELEKAVRLSNMKR